MPLIVAAVDTIEVSLKKEFGGMNKSKIYRLSVPIVVVPNPTIVPKSPT